MTVLVTWSSKHGSTAEIGELIAETLSAGGVDAVARPMDEVETVFPYEAYVVGSAVYMGKWLRAARDFVHEHGELLSTRPTWVFSSGPLGSSPHAAAAEPFDDAWLVDAVDPVGHRVFSGRLVKHDLGIADRVVASTLRVPDGDFRDWSEIAGWAASIGHALKPARVG